MSDDRPTIAVWPWSDPVEPWSDLVKGDYDALLFEKPVTRYQVVIVVKYPDSPEEDFEIGDSYSDEGLARSGAEAVATHLNARGFISGKIFGWVTAFPAYVVRRVVVRVHG